MLPRRSRTRLHARRNNRNRFGTFLALSLSEWGSISLTGFLAQLESSLEAVLDCAGITLGSNRGDRRFHPYPGLVFPLLGSWPLVYLLLGTSCRIREKMILANLPVGRNG